MLVIGGAAIAGGAYAAWEVKTDIGELKYAIGYADGAAGSDSVLGQLKAINDTLKTLKAAPPGTDASPSPLEQRSALQP